MKRKLFKKLVERAQRQQAKIDYLLGVGPRKTSKTYYEAYGHYYAEGEGVVYYDFAPF